MAAAIGAGAKSCHGVRSRVLFPAFAILLSFIFVVGASAAAQARIAASVVIDQTTGEILHSYNPDTARAPASLTKIMTLYMIFEALERGDITLDTRWRVSRYASRRQPSKLYLRAGTRISVRATMLAIAVKSANDAAAVAAEGLAGSESAFARQMTRRARELGMENTTFRNASGLPASGQTTTARDMGILAHAVYRDFPQYYSYFSQRSFRFGRRTYRNTNRLLRRHRGIDGMKTGYTRRARYNLITSSEHDGERIAVVVLGATSSRERYNYTTGIITAMWGGIPGQRGTMVAEAAEARENGETRQASAASNRSSEERERRRVAIANRARAAEQAQAQASRTRVNAIQVGTFRNFSSAEGEARRAMASLPDSYRENTRLVVAPRNGRTGRFYRARILGLSGNRAAQACRHLIENDVRCITILHDAPARRIQIAGTATTQTASAEADTGNETQAASNAENAEQEQETAATEAAEQEDERHETGPYAIQVGAFQYLGDAQRAVRRVNARLPAQYRQGTRSVILNKHRGYYRVRYLGMSRARAARACRILRSRNERCIALRHVSQSQRASRSRSNGRYAIQVGSFRRISNARRAARRAQSRLPRAYRQGTRMIILNRRHGYYRVRFIGMSRARAVRACRQLRNRNMRCIAVRHG